jgi:hypothetical protein
VTRKRQNLEIEQSAAKNVAVYQHSEGWKIMINEDTWSILENTTVPEEAKEFLDLPLQDLIELGIINKTEQIKKEKPEVEEKKSKQEVKSDAKPAVKDDDDDFSWPL